MSPVTAAKTIRLASTSEIVPEIGESALMLAEAFKKYKKKKQETEEKDDDEPGEDEEQSTSPPTGEAGEGENITAIQIWDEFMVKRTNELPDTEYIKTVSSLVGGEASDALAARANLQILSDQENFIRDPEKNQSELRRKMIKLYT